MPSLSPLYSSSEALNKHPSDRHSKLYSATPLCKTKTHIPLGLDSKKTDVPVALCLGWALVLAAYTGNEDVTFGLERDEQQPVLVQVHVQPKSTVAKGLSTVDASIKQTTQFHHGRTSEDGSKPTESPSISQFDSMVIVGQYRKDGESSMAGRAISIICELYDEGIQIHALFNDKLMSLDKLRMMLHQLAHNIHSIVKRGAQDWSLQDISGISPAGLNQLLHWNSRAPPPQSATCVHEAIKEKCLEQPTAIAVDAWDGKLTYGLLDGLASKLASQLRDLGPEQFACILMEKSMWVSVAMLAIMKAGGAFVLLDPAQPAHRMRQICNRVRARHVLCSPRLRALADELGPSVLQIPILAGGEPAPLSKEISGTLSSSIQPQNALYAIFTSGSTGEPKGVVTDHGAFYTGIQGYGSHLGLNARSRVLQAVSHAYAVCILDYLGTLVHGSCLCVPAEADLQDDMASTAKRLDVNWAIMTPSMARILGSHDSQSSLETLVLTGEQITRADIDSWQGRVPTLYLHYGQTENTTGTLVSMKPTSPCEELDLRALYAARCWVVDRDNYDVLVPIGAEGELLIEGPSIARGYLDDETQTRAAFVEPPAWLRKLNPGTKSPVFKTGDIVRYHCGTGAIEFVGRKGTQVKLRGQRIELAEVEVNLHQQFLGASQVVADIILPSDVDDMGHAILAGFVLAHDQGDAVADEDSIILQPTDDFGTQVQTAISNLQEILPGYMVPTVIIAVRRFPLTISGKLDRRALRQHVSTLTRRALLSRMVDQKTDTSDPVTQKQVIILNACARALGVSLESIGMQYSFSALGGDSLVARRLSALCRDAGLLTTVANIFLQPSLVDLAACSVWTSKAKLGSNPIPVEDPFAQLKLDLSRDLPSLLHGNDIEDVLPTGIMHDELVNVFNAHMTPLSGPIERIQLRRACEMLVKQHAILRSVFIPYRGRMIQVLLREIPVEYTCFTVSPDTDLLSWAESFSRGEMGSSRPADGPGVKFTLLERESDAENRLLILQIRHTQYDGSSVPMLMGDIWSAYENKAITARPSFSDLVRQTHRDRETLEYTEFWRTLLLHAPPPRFPFLNCEESHPRGFVVNDSYIPIVKPPPRGITMATVTKAAWSYVLRQETGKDDIIFSHLANYRDSVIMEGADLVIGPCLNTPPIRVRYDQDLQSRSPSNGPTIQDLLELVQEQYIQSLKYNSVDWNFLVEKCTEWPAGIKPRFVAMHQGFASAPAVQIGDLHCAEPKAVLDVVSTHIVFAKTTPVENGLMVRLQAAKGLIADESGKRLVARFCDTMIRFLDSPDSPLVL